MTWEIWKRKSGEIIVNFSTFWGNLIDDIQKSDCCGMNSEQKQSLTSSHGSLACVFLLFAVFWTLFVHFFSAKSILSYFSSPRGVATSVPFPEIRSRKGTESGLFETWVLAIQIYWTFTSQVPQPLLLVVGWVYNAPKTVKFFFASFHRVHLVTHWEKVIKIR